MDESALNDFLRTLGLETVAREPAGPGPVGQR